MNSNLNTNATKSIFDMAQENSSDSFSQSTVGCCSRYLECSNARHCVSDSVETRSKCAYNKNLQNGLVFYGKNANNFRRNIYEKYVDEYHKLNRAESATLWTILHLFLTERRGLNRELFADEPELFSLNRSGFIQLSCYSVEIMNKMKLSVLKESVKDAKQMQRAEQWVKEHCTSDGNNSSISRYELCQWISENEPNIAADLCKGVHYIELSRSHILELDEFYRDCFDSTQMMKIEKADRDNSKFLKGNEPYKINKLHFEGKL